MEGLVEADHDCANNRHCKHVLARWEDPTGQHTKYICCFCGFTETFTIPPKYVTGGWSWTPKAHGPYYRVEARL